MGLVHVEMTVSASPGRSRTVRMLVDSGAAFSCLPENDWKALGLRGTNRYDFSLADGTIITRDVSECRFRYEGREATSPVILGNKDDVALLGVVTLESLALVFNPLERSLKPAKLLLLMEKRHPGLMPFLARGETKTGQELSGRS